MEMEIQVNQRYIKTLKEVKKLKDFINTLDVDEYAKKNLSGKIELEIRMIEDIIKSSLGEQAFEKFKELSLV